MEVKINREIKEYTESFFFGLTLRQCIFSALACISAVIIYFVCKPYFGVNVTSWLCIVGALPFAALAFVKYNGMTAEKLFIVWVRYMFLIPKKLKYKSYNTYFELMKKNIEERQKEEKLKDETFYKPI